MVSKDYLYSISSSSLIFLITLFLSGCSGKKMSEDMKNTTNTYSTRSSELSSGAIKPDSVSPDTHSNMGKHVTIMIHGTIPVPNELAFTPPLKQALSRYIGTPAGLKHANELGKHAFVELADVLCKQAPNLFDIHNFYFFGWSGALSHKTRKLAAQELYDAIKSLHLSGQDTLTIITHSHAGNVALYLADIVAEKHDPVFKIDRLILLACPVQDITEEYCNAPLFKRIYNIYSMGDLVQVLDPQGMQGKRHAKVKTFFSRRAFAPHSNLIQAEVRFKRRAPGHLDFIKPDFMKALPTILEKLDNEELRTKLPITSRGALSVEYSP